MGPPPRVGIELQAQALTVFEGEPERAKNAVRLRSLDDQVGTDVNVPVRSLYRILIRAASDKDRSQPMPIEVLCDGDPVAVLEATGSSFELVELPAGEHRVVLRIKAASNANRSSVDSATIRFLSIAGPFTLTSPRRSDYLQAMLGPRPIAMPVLRLSGEELGHGSGRNSLDTGRAWFSSNGFRHAPVHVPTTGEYRVRFKVGAQQIGDEPTRFEVRLGDKTLGPFSVTVQSQAEQWLETKCELTAGKHDWQVWFVNEYTDPETRA